MAEAESKNGTTLKQVKQN